MSNKLNMLRKIWGKNKTDCEDVPELQPKDRSYFQLKFDNHENPERSFILDVDNPQPVYYARTSYEKSNPSDKGEETETEVIMGPKQRRKKEHKKRESTNKQSIPVDLGKSIVLSQPRVFTWKNKDAFVYTVESNYNDSERPDLEFVIYIPIDTAVTWLNSKEEKPPDYISEQPTTEKNAQQALIESPQQERKYGAEEHDEKNDTAITRQNEKKSESLDSDDEEENEDKKKEPKPKKIKEKKVRAPKMKKKKARRIITTYEEDEDEISLGRLRPEESPKKPVKIVAAKDIY